MKAWAGGGRSAWRSGPRVYGPDEIGEGGAVRLVEAGGGVGGYRTNFAKVSGARDKVDFTSSRGMRSKIISSAL